MPRLYDPKKTKLVLKKPLDSSTVVTNNKQSIFSIQSRDQMGNHRSKGKIRTSLQKLAARNSNTSLILKQQNQLQSFSNQRNPKLNNSTSCKRVIKYQPNKQVSKYELRRNKEKGKQIKKTAIKKKCIKLIEPQLEASSQSPQPSQPSQPSGSPQLIQKHRQAKINQQMCEINPEQQNPDVKNFIPKKYTSLQIIPQFAYHIQSNEEKSVKVKKMEEEIVCLRNLNSQLEQQLRTTYQSVKQLKNQLSLYSSNQTAKYQEDTLFRLQTHKSEESPKLPTRFCKKNCQKICRCLVEQFETQLKA